MARSKGGASIVEHAIIVAITGCAEIGFGAKLVGASSDAMTCVGTTMHAARDARAEERSQRKDEREGREEPHPRGGPTE